MAFGENLSLDELAPSNSEKRHNNNREFDLNGKMEEESEPRLKLEEQHRERENEERVPILESISHEIGTIEQKPSGFSVGKQESKIPAEQPSNGWDSLKSWATATYKEGAKVVTDLYSDLKSYFSNFFSQESTKEVAKRIRGEKSSAQERQEIEDKVVSKIVRPKESHQGARETVSQEVERILGDNNLMKKGLARSLEYANKLRDEFLINDVSFNQKIGAFVEGYDIQNPESEANIKGWKAINQVIESEILSGYFEKIDAPAFLKSFVMARLQYKANEIIIDKIAQKVSTNQIVIRQKAVLTFQQSALESYEVAPERARQIIQNVFSKPEINQRSVARENVEEMTSEVMILRYQRMAAIKRDLASFNLTAQDYALDPADSTAMTEFRRHHPELSEGAKFLYIKNRLFELRQAQLEAQDDQMIATLVARSVVAESEGQSEAQIAAIQDEVNYQAYKDVYDQIDYNEAGYELLTQSAGTDLSGAAAYLIVANVDSPVLAQTFFDTIDATSARVTDLHLENGVLHGTVITRWSNERSFSMSPENGAISIEDKMADSGQRKANLQDGEDLKKALFLTDFEEGMRKEIKDFGELSGSESAVFARINDTELYEIVGELNLSLLENESKQRQFFQNFLSLLLEKGDEVPINDKLIILRKSLTDGKARSTFVRKLNHPSWEFKSALQNKKFAEFMDELRQGNVAD